MSVTINKSNTIKFFGSKYQEYMLMIPFWAVDIYIDNQRYNCIEHAYQAARFRGNPTFQKRILECKSGTQAKKLADSYYFNHKQNAEWNAIRDSVMLTIVRALYKQDSELADRLIDTGTSYLQYEHPTDRYWGECRKKVGKKYMGSILGLNKFGFILMKVREELMEEENNESSSSDDSSSSSSSEDYSSDEDLKNNPRLNSHNYELELELESDSDSSN